MYDLEKPNKIILFRLSSIGDIILTTPLIRCLKKTFPAVRIDFVIKKEYADLMQFNPHISELIVFDKSSGMNGLIKTRKYIIQERYDFFIDIHKNFRSLIVKTASRIKHRKSYSKSIWKRTILIWFKINLFKNVKPVYLKYFDTVQEIQVPYDGLGTEVFIPGEVMGKVDKMLVSHAIDRNKEFITICPGATYWNKRWPAEKFMGLIELIDRKTGYQVILLGGPGDRELCQFIKNSTSVQVTDFSGRLSLLESGALLSKSHCVVTNDSGMMHLAQSQKTPVVAIFGATVKELGFFPLKDKSIVIEHSVPCRPCTHKGLDRCPRKHFKCMNSIEIKEVFKGLEKLLKKH